MSAKIILVFCAQAFFVQVAFSQCFGRDAYYGGFGNYGLITPGLANNIACTAAPAIDIIATSGGNLPVTSSSINPPTGLIVASENLYEGLLAAAGELPFVGTVAVDGVLPTAGVGAVNYGCGNGITDIFAETIPAAAAFSPAGITAPIAGISPAAAIAPAAAFGIPANFAGFPGSRCGALY